MPVQIQNNSIVLVMDLPDEGYDFSRFDWTGKIISVKFKGVEFAALERTDTSDLNTYGRGFCNEFGIDQPVGFDQAGTGDQFHKIGIGLLTKEHPEYEFLRPHKIEPARFETDVDSNGIIVRCVSKNHNGYAYELSKFIQLEEDGFSIKYELSNTGINPIQTTEYGHNFISVDQSEIDDNYRLVLPFSIDSSNFGEFVDPENIFLISENEIEFKHSTVNPFFISYLNGKDLVQGSWEIQHKNKKLAISESCSFKTSKFNLWGWSHVISPEIFKEITLLPGESEKWSRTYSFRHLL